MADSKKYTPRVPSAYQEVEYIESNGTQYIDTGITPSNAAQTKFTFSYRLTVNDGGYQSIGSNSNLNFYGYLNYGFFRPNGQVTDIPIDTNWHIIEMSKSSSGKKTIFDGVEFFTTGTTEEPLHFYIFALNALNQDQIYYGKYQFKECKAYENGVMVRDFIPVVRKTDNLAGLYDIVNDVFYTNQGTGSFIAGSDVNNWQHSLRKLTTATEAVENPLYSDGTAITAYAIKGNTVQNGTPTPSAPLPVNGVGNKTANLLDYSFVTSTSYVTVTPITNGINLTGTYFAEINGISISVGTTYYMSWNAEIISGNVYVSWRVQYTDDTYSALTQSGNALTIAKEVAKILFYINTTNTQASANITNIMLNSGSTALPYEPYGFKIPISSGGVTTPIYLTGQLMKKDTVVDDFSSSGTVTYNIKKMVLDGSEDWQIEMTDNFYINTPLSGNTGRATVLCTHQVSTSNSYVTGENCFISPSGRFNFTTSAITHTVNDFKTWLQQQYAAGTPVTLWYVLATPTTETVTAPSIPTTDGANSITVDTTVQPSEFTATWTGWHDSSVKEYDGSDWQ